MRSSVSLQSNKTMAWLNTEFRESNHVHDRHVPERKSATSCAAFFLMCRAEAKKSSANGRAGNNFAMLPPAFLLEHIIVVGTEVERGLCTLDDDLSASGRNVADWWPPLSSPACDRCIGQREERLGQSARLGRTAGPNAQRQNNDECTHSWVFVAFDGWCGRSPGQNRSAKPNRSDRRSCPGQR